MTSVLYNMHHSSSKAGSGKADKTNEFGGITEGNADPYDVIEKTC